ncbi:MAG: hypothetical protein KAV45_09985 [Calditrichia bacterium]|nr:hypothetical protein [Calditrichia bacterium]
MKSLFVFLFIVSISIIGVNGSDSDWIYEFGYQDRLLYIHPFVNYDYNAYWYNNWERNFFKGNGFLFSVGSVTTSELLVDGALVINESLGKGWRFRGEGRWFETLHLKNVEKSTFMGLEKEVLNNSSIYLIVNPAYDKEYTDLNMGILYADSTYENYIRLGLLWEDFVYADKNNMDGVTDRVPLNLEWYARYQSGRFVFYSQGRLSQGFERRFPNLELSPDLTSHDLQHSNFTVKLYYFPSDVSILNLSFYNYQFNETKTFYADSFNYNYNTRISDIGLDYLLTFKEVNRLRFQLHYVTNRAKSIGYREHFFKREDFLTALSYERFFSRHIIELQYMFALPSWDYISHHEEEVSYDYQGIMDKVKIGWTYNFPQGSKIHISVSHEVQVGNFGGANLQYILIF